jgi:hypothetical protein
MRSLIFRGLPLAICFAGIVFAQAGAPQPLLIEDAGFIPSGWMGDGAVKVDRPEQSDVQVNPRSTVNPHSPPYCQQWSYRPRLGKAGWTAMAWQFPEQNWGDKPGKDWSKKGFSRVTVWARGVRDRRGNLPKVQFKAGGGSNPAKKYQASFEAETDFVTLTEDWRQYSIDLKGQDLSQVIAAFVLVIRAQDVGPEGAILYLDDIEYR